MPSTEPHCTVRQTVFLPDHTDSSWPRATIVSTNNFDDKVRKAKDGYRSTKHSANETGLTALAATAENVAAQHRLATVM